MSSYQESIVKKYGGVKVGVKKSSMKNVFAVGGSA